MIATLVIVLVFTVPDVNVVLALSRSPPSRVLFGPILWYPFSKTLWVAADRAILQRLDPYDAPTTKGVELGPAREQCSGESSGRRRCTRAACVLARSAHAQDGRSARCAEKLDAVPRRFVGATMIVELGAGQAWASCAVAQLELGAGHRVVATDIAYDAVVSHRRWEALLDGQPAGVAACRSASLPFRDGSVDLVFAFAAVHHFGTQRTTLLEIARVLRPGARRLLPARTGLPSVDLPTRLSQSDAQAPGRSRRRAA